MKLFYPFKTWYPWLVIARVLLGCISMTCQDQVLKVKFYCVYVYICTSKYCFHVLSAGNGHSLAKVDHLNKKIIHNSVKTYNILMKQKVYTWNLWSSYIISEKKHWFSFWVWPILNPCFAQLGSKTSNIKGFTNFFSELEHNNINYCYYLNFQTYLNGNQAKISKWVWS